MQSVIQNPSGLLLKNWAQSSSVILILSECASQSSLRWTISDYSDFYFQYKGLKDDLG